MRAMLPGVVIAVAGFISHVPVATAQHLDVFVYALGDEVRASSLADRADTVFQSSFEAFDEAPGVVMVENPGWNALASSAMLPDGAAVLPPAKDVGFDVIAFAGRNLSYWNGQGDVAFTGVPAGEHLTYGRLFGRSISVDGGADGVPGLVVGRTDGNGALHRHLLFSLYGSESLDPQSPDAPTAGVYLLALEPWVEGFDAPANSIHIVFGHGVSDLALRAGTDWVAQATAVPEPAGYGLFVVGIAVLSLWRRCAH